MDDEELMSRIQQGDQQAFRHLVDHYLHPLYRFAQQMLGNQADAEEVVQEVFVKVWYRAEQWRTDKAKLSTWLHTITHHLCIDWHRRQKITTQDLNNDELEQIAIPEFADGIHQVEISDQVTKALQQLPERQRSAVLLCYYQGLSNQEAAQVLKLTVNALESLLARARRTLKQQLLKTNDN